MPDLAEITESHSRSCDTKSSNFENLAQQSLQEIVGLRWFKWPCHVCRLTLHPAQGVEGHEAPKASRTRCRGVDVDGVGNGDWVRVTASLSD